MLVVLRILNRLSRVALFEEEAKVSREKVYEKSTVEKLFVPIHSLCLSACHRLQWHFNEVCVGMCRDDYTSG